MGIGNQLKTVALIGLLSGLILAVGGILGGYEGLTVALIIALLFNGISYFFSHKIVLAMYRAQPADPHKHSELISIVRDVAHLANIPAPKVYVVPSANPNAFATGRNPKNGIIACTTGILDLLNKNELRGVIAHEMAHIKNRDILVATIAATMAAIISYVAMMARWAAIFGGFGGRDGDTNIVEWLFLAILTPIIAVIIQLAISRSREYLADETGAKFIHDPHSLAHALEKLHGVGKNNKMRFGSPSTASIFIDNPFSAKGFLALFSTHPSMESRVKKLKSMRV